MKNFTILLTVCMFAFAASKQAPGIPITDNHNVWQVPVTAPLPQENNQAENNTDIIPNFTRISKEQFIPVTYSNATQITFSNGISFNTKVLGKNGEPELPGALKIENRGNEPGYYIVQFSGPVYEAQKGWLRANGARIHFYVPDYGFVAGIDDPETADAISANPAVNWVGIYQPAYKISQAFEQVGEEHIVTILVFMDSDLQSVLNEVNSMTQRSGFETSDNGINKMIRGVVNKKDLAALASIKGIYWIEPYIHPELHNQQYQWVVQTGYRSSAPGGGDNTARRMWGMGIFGQGEIINHCDTGINCSHYQHRSNSTAITTWGVYPAHNAICAYDSGAPSGVVFGDNMAQQWHGTHTSCTTSGDDTVLGSSYYDGVAKRAKIYHNDIGDAAGALFLFMDLNDLYIRPYNKYYASNGIRAYSTTNSWGAAVAGAYDASCLCVDQFMWSHRDFLMFFSNGNSGSSGSVGSPASAKNCVSVGGTSNSTACQTYYATTSRGPAADGRRKPTILTPGDGIYSATSGTGGYATYSGTSMSSPGACASGSLARQYLREGWYPTGKKVAGNAWAYISAAMIKAILINCADPNISGYTVPDNNIGWGRVDLDSTLYFSGDSRKTLLDDDTIGVLTGERADYHINVPSGAVTLKIAVVWTDYPGNPAITRQIVNDLDLYVLNPSGTYYRGNQYSGGQSSANPAGRDSVNVEECVRVNAPTAGDWLVRVEGRNVPYGPQPFALAVTYSATAVAGVVHTDKPVYRANDFIVDTVRVRVEDPNYGAVGIRDTVRVSIIGKYIETQPETLRCVELAESSYVFKGEIPLLFRGATHGDGRLSACQGDTLTVTYVDANPSYTSTTWAAVDAWYFTISNAHCENIEAIQAEMCWNTSEGANSIVYYGTNPSNLNLTMTVDTPFCMPHRVRLTGLTPNTIYYCDVASKDFRGNQVRDNNGGAHYTFKTKAQAGVDILVILADGNSDATPQGQPLPQLRERFRKAVETGGWNYSYWETSDNAGYTPSRSVIKNYKATFVVYEDEYPPFTAAQQETIRQYEQNGGRIAFASHDVLWWSWDPAGGNPTIAADSQWCKNYMQARYKYDITPVGTYNIYGVSGDPISGPYSGTPVSFTAHRDGACADSVEPVNNPPNAWDTGTGTRVWLWNGASAGRVGSKWESANTHGTLGDGVWGGYRTRTIMNAFSITQMDTTKLPDILNNEFIWLIGHDHPDVTVTSPVGGNTYSSSPISIAWTATTYGGTTVDTTWIEYSPDAGNTWYAIVSGTGITSPYSWNISALQNGSKYRVRVTVNDIGVYPSMKGFAQTGNFTINITGNDDIGPKVVPNTIIVANNPKFVTATDTLMAFTAVVSDSETGLSTIGAASYRATSQTGNSSGEQAMSVQDGSWDEIQETVNASIRFVYTPGVVNICTLSVRARDNAAKALNWGVWYSRTFTIIDGDIRPLVGVGEHTALAPVAYAFSDPVPNPALGSVRITYALPSASKVSLKIYNSVGQLVRTAVKADQKAGYYTFTWDGRDDTGRHLAAGIYFYHFSANQYQSTRKSVLLK